MPKKPDPALLVKAIRTVNHLHSLADAIYDVRERHGGDDGFTGNSWEHPKVLAYNAAITDLRAMGALDPLPEDQTERERRALVDVIKHADLTSLSTEALQGIAAHLP